MDVNLNKDKIFIDSVKLDNNNETKVIDFERILFMKERLYFLKY